MAISHTDYAVDVLCRNFSILNAVRTMLSQAKQLGVNVEICVPSHEFQSTRRTLSQITVRSIAPTSVFATDWTENTAVLRNRGSGLWGLYIRNPPIIANQWQVIRTLLAVLSGQQREMFGAKEGEAERAGSGRFPSQYDAPR
ncbi:MAG: hypothetical protein DRO93_03650 [Candidatus Thorarchaeota archaeon]|nr:MAG: hypothetical protein DRO93_03650 [Candidatus Thorarchaeota archaeon]